MSVCVCVCAWLGLPKGGAQWCGTLLELNEEKATFLISHPTPPD